MTQDWAVPFAIDPFILPGMKAGLSTGKPAARAAKSASTGTPPAATRVKPASVALPAEDDAALVECLAGIRGRDQKALARLYDLTVSRVYAIALRIVRHADMAGEVVSDVYMQVWRDAHRYDDERGKVLAWLLVIARSRSLDFLRRQDEAFSHPDPHALVSESESETRKCNPQDLLEATQAGSAVRAAMLRLSPLQRQLLSLAFFRGLTHTEIVEHSGIPLGSVKTHIRRALAILRNTLEEQSSAGETS
ncbi:MAG: sigma-70 family RNA polymerase sigma factor [Betaproteobacteria bacterium]